MERDARNSSRTVRRRSVVVAAFGGVSLALALAMVGCAGGDSRGGRVVELTLFADPGVPLTSGEPPPRVTLREGEAFDRMTALLPAPFPRPPIPGEGSYVCLPFHLSIRYSDGRRVGYEPCKRKGARRMLGHPSLPLVAETMCVLLRARDKRIARCSL